MEHEVPAELTALLDGSDPTSLEDAWTALLERYSGLLLKAARHFGHDYDRTMDRYEYILSGLRHDDYRRLRSYRARPESAFGSWLVVVARRLCLDFERSTYGRSGRGADADRAEQRLAARRRLVDLVGAAVDPEQLPTRSTNPERAMRMAELNEALEEAVAHLEARDRLLLRLRFEDDRSVREITEVMRFPSVFHVYRRLNRVLEELRGRLQSAGIRDPSP